MKNGDFRILVNLGSYKPEEYQDIPLAKEKGIDAAVDVYTGLIGPKGLPEKEMNIIHDAFKKALEDPEIQKELKNIDVDAAYAGPEEFQKEISESYEKYGDILRGINMIK